MSEPVAGIDLGTSNSCLACYFKGKSEVILSRVGERTTPSQVVFTQKGEVRVGAVAKRNAITHATRTVIGSKRLVGRAHDSDEVRILRPTLGYEVVEAANGDAWVQIGDRAISPVEVQAHILSTLKSDAHAFFGREVKDAVITVPAYFDETQRQAVRDASAISGLNAVRIISEPTAAALAYGYSKVDKLRAVVFDLGGGTFDVTVIEIDQGRFDVLATDGDMLLGGQDFDRLLAQRFAHEIMEKHGFDPLIDPTSRQRLMMEAERVKHELSAFGTVETSLPHLSDGMAEPVHYQRSTSSAEFEELVLPLLQRLAAPTMRALDEAGVRDDQIDEILAVGGMTRCPPVRTMCEELLHRKPLSRVNPDEAVALGAAVYTGIISGQLPKSTVVDVTPRGLGLRTTGDRYSPLISKSTPLPAKASKDFRAVDDRAVTLEIRQGESDVASENRRLAWVDLVDFRPEPGTVYSVSFEVSEEGQLQVSAENTSTGDTLATEIRPSSGLTKAQLAQLIREFAERRNKEKPAHKKKTKITFS